MEINFKTFKVQELFYTQKELKKKFNLVKFSKIPTSKGETAFISSKESNNGIATFCNLKSQFKDCITVSTNGECLKCFYHSYGIVPSTDVEVLILRERELTPEIACYINACIEKHKYKFNHSNKPKNGKVFELEILLPTDKIGNINWQYITQYIKEIEAQYIKEIEAYLKAAKLDNCDLSKIERELLNKIQKTGFTNFNTKLISDLFYIRNNPSLDKRDIKLCDDFNLFPYFTRTEFNNGFSGYTREIPKGYKNPGNSIAVGLMGMKFFYMDKDFCSGQFTKTLIPKGKFNENLSLFYLTFLNKNSENLKANLVRDFNNIANKINVVNLPNEEIEIFISAIKKIVVNDLITWYKNKLNSYYIFCKN